MISEAMWDEINIGSNIFLNTPGVFTEDDQPVITLERAGTEDQLLVSIEVYDVQDGATRHVAKLRRNAWAFNDGDRYNVTTTPYSLRLIDKQDERVLLEANVSEASVNKIVIPRGSFYTPRGQLIIVEPDQVRIGGVTLVGIVIQAPKGIVLGPGGFGLAG
jgi:hypothetical protein